MAKLYPPIISGTLPAFYLEESGTDRFIKITVPFSMNRAVSKIQVKGFALKIKTVQSSSYLYTTTVTNPLFFEMEDSAWATFTLRTSNGEAERELLLKHLKVGLFYKLQIAYIDTNDNVGNYSTVGISKYTTKPSVYINDFKMGLTNTHKYEYLGFYSQEEGDITEKAYLYRFDLYDELDNIIDSTGDQIHNSNNDVELYESYDRYNYNKDLELNKIHKIQYTVQTNNGLTISSPRYRIMQRTTIDPDLKAELVASVNFDNGYIDIGLIGEKKDDGVEDIVTGSFILSRASEDTKYLEWEEISRFKLVAQFATRDLWQDFTAQQGKHYKYSIQQYNDKQLYSNRIISNEVYSDFEDAFLYDGERQLKIKYNPKIGNIKTNILEAKTDTIGNKYPFFFRNGHVNYKEFSISGLISYFMDNESFFLKEEEFTVKEPTTNLIGENLSAERTFKMKVLEWLNDGKPKLFRSPTEGNFIVRLMKVTLNPENKLGRMLHTFNSTAYEIAECNYENLGKYNFIHLDYEEKQYMRWETIEFTELDENRKPKYKSGMILNRHPARTVRFNDMRPGQLITMVFEDDTVETFMIGVTGSYLVDKGVAIRAITLGDKNPYIYSEHIPGVEESITTYEDPYLRGSMTYSFYSIQSNLFDKISDIQVTEVPVHQFIGEHDIIKEIEYIKYENSWYRNPKIDILTFYYINAQKRTEEKLIQFENTYYTDNAKKNEFDFVAADPFTLYKIGSGYTITPVGDVEIGYNPSRAKYTFNATHYYDFFNKETYPLKLYTPYITINGEQVSVADTEVFDLFKPGKLTSLTSGNGTNVTVAYQMRIIDYLIEEDETYPALQEAKNAYLSLKNQLNKYYEILSFFNGMNEDNTLLEEEKAAILNDLRVKYDAKKVSYNEEIEKINAAYEEEARVAQTEYENALQIIENQIRTLENKSNLTDNEKALLFQYTQAKHVLVYEYTQNQLAKDDEREKLIKELNLKLAQIEENYREDASYYTRSYDTQIAELQEKRVTLIEECQAIFGFDPSRYTIDQAQHFYETIEQPMRDTLNYNYARYIYELVQAQNEEKKAEGLL